MDIELSEIVVTPLRSVHVGKECHLRLSLVQEIHPQTRLASYGFYQLVVKDKKGCLPFVSVFWTRKEALEEFYNRFSTIYYTNIN